MSALHKVRLTGQGQPPLLLILRLAILLLPTMLLLGVSLRSPGDNNLLLWVGTGLQAGVCGLAFLGRRSWRQPLGSAAIACYLIALGWLWCGNAADDWYGNLVKAMLLVIPLGVFAIQTLQNSGAPRFAGLGSWPISSPAARNGPLSCRRAVRCRRSRPFAPPLALTPRRRWRCCSTRAWKCAWPPCRRWNFARIGGPARRNWFCKPLSAEQPAIRAAAIFALANVDDQALVEALAHFLHDPSPDVRRAATEALLWDTEHRWNWIRFIVRRVLADPLYVEDGALTHDGQLLTVDAVNDLTAWCAEKGILAARAALTLGHHFQRALAEQPDEKVTQALRRQLADSHTPAMLRIELGRLLRNYEELDMPMLELLMQSSNPAPLRLIAVDALLTDHADKPQASVALTALRELARLPNREIALTTADLVQRRLGVDLGLALGQPLPPVHSRQAAEISRRVMTWANQNDEGENIEDSRPLEDSRV